jgi:hypothetical protein
MRKLIALGVVFCLVGIAFPKGDEDSPELFEFHRLTAVVAPFTGPANPIRNLGGGGAPWQIRSGRAEMNAKGRLEVRVRGLVLVKTGANPIGAFAVILSCQSIDGAGAPSVVNLVAGTTPATTTGDADFEGAVTPPSPCIAPIVFVAIPATAAAGARWLAASGF